MVSPGGLATGMAYLPAWLTDTADAAELDSLLCGWVKANGWRSAGFAWPCEGPPQVVIMARAEASDRPPQAPAELPDVTRSLLGGAETVVWQVPSSAGRLYTLVSPPGRPAGVVWADRGPSEPWSDLDRGYLKLSGRIIERSASLSKIVGPIVDNDRLQNRLADAAVIAGRMAHDFDNILTGIIGFADLTVPLVPAGSQPAKFVSEIGKVGQRGIQFTQQLHQLSRSAHVKPLPSSVAQAVAKEEARLRPLMPMNCSILSHPPTTLPPVAMEAGPLQAVIGHLLQNAIEATPATGPVVVNARAVEYNPTDAKAYLGHVGSGAHIEVTIQDAGPGIKPEHQAKLFTEPFFTTKVRHRGLGLCIAYRTLVAHRGGIRIESSAVAPAGTTVRIAIPLAAARPPVTVGPTTGFASYSPSVKG
jgi:signal transduction histidine kinase